jgi:hypothetical protein
LAELLFALKRLLHPALKTVFPVWLSVTRD